jgi:hypothetical protein
MFKSKLPKTKDVIYVEDVFSLLINGYKKIRNEKSKAEIFPNLVGFDELKSFIRKLLFELNIEVRIVQSEEIEQEYVFGLPRTFYFDDLNGRLQLSITKFGSDNPQVTICEVVPLLVSIRLEADESVNIGDEIFQNIEEVYRPLMIVISIYFGFGEVFLARNWISGNYLEDVSGIVMNYVYSVPLDLNTIIYAFSLISFLQNKIYQEPIPDITYLNKAISKEYKSCIKYLKNGGSQFANSFRTSAPQ